MAGRGRLSSIDLLPEEAGDDIVWACQQLAQRTRTQADILFELNDRLEAKGLEGLSKSAFNRYSVRKAAAQRRMQEGRAIFAGVADQFAGEDLDKHAVLLGEYIKTLVLELVDETHGQRSPKEAMELARAYQAVVSAQEKSLERQRAALAKATATMTAAVEAVAGEAEKNGHTIDRAAVLKRIREDVYGIFET
jgi:hypothetical protein